MRRMHLRSDHTRRLISSTRSESEQGVNQESGEFELRRTHGSSYAYAYARLNGSNIVLLLKLLDDEFLETIKGPLVVGENDDQLVDGDGYAFGQ